MKADESFGIQVAISGVNYLDLLYKTSLKRWLQQSFY